MNETPVSTEPADEAIAVPYPEFKAGLPVGRYRLIVNPQKATRYLMHRLFINGISMPLIGIGIALVLTSHAVIGICLGALGIALRQFVKSQGPNILLYLAQHDAKVYYDSIEFEIMEVRAARD